jgi:hypothetical protein
MLVEGHFLCQISGFSSGRRMINEETTRAPRVRNGASLIVYCCKSAFGTTVLHIKSEILNQIAENVSFRSAFLKKLCDLKT